jgi:hypothetical protein
MTTKNSKKTEKHLLFQVKTGNNQIIEIERTSDWEINITQTAKKLNKRWRNWKKWNAKTIETFEKLEGRKLIRETGDKRNPQTFLALVLALRVLNDYDSVLSYQIFKLYEQELLANPSLVLAKLDSFKKKIQLLEAENAKLKNSAIDVNLKKGENLLYGYECNKKTKFGTSFTNKNGQRPKSHKTSVPDLSLGFVLYSSKQNLQNLSKAIKDRYNTKTEHLDCSVTDLEKFVFRYCDLMNWKYIKEDIHTLKLLNIFLAS